MFPKDSSEKVSVRARLQLLPTVQGQKKCNPGTWCRQIAQSGSADTSPGRSQKLDSLLRGKAEKWQSLSSSNFMPILMEYEKTQKGGKRVRGEEGQEMEEGLKEESLKTRKEHPGLLKPLPCLSAANKLFPVPLKWPCGQTTKPERCRLEGNISEMWLPIHVP